MSSMLAGKGVIQMASEQEVKALWEQLLAAGVQSSQLTAMIKSAKQSGQIVSKRGAVPSNDPSKIKVRELVMGLDGLLKIVVDAASKDNLKSFMVKLTDDWSINFIKKVPRVTKEKKEEPKKDFSEPALA